MAEASEELARFESAIDLVEAIAHKIAREIGPIVDFEDLQSFGREGLLDAARRFDPSRGVPFRGYASFRVRGSILDGVRRSAALPRRLHAKLAALDSAGLVSEGALEDTLAAPGPTAASADAERGLVEHLAAMATAMAVGLLSATAYGDEGERVPVEGAEGPEEALGRAELLEVVKQAIVELPEKESELVRRHYLEGERFDQVARDLGLSKSWASRLHTRAIKRLSRSLRGQAG